MKKYIFDFGRNNKLLLAETISYLKMEGVNFKFDKILNGGALVSISNFDPIRASRRLGGTKRIAEVLCRDYKKLGEMKLYRRPGSKFFYRVKDMRENDERDEIKEVLKTRFKEENLKAMYREMDLGKTVKKNSLEILIFPGNYIGKTVSISNPLDFKERDMQRPNRDREITTSIRLSDILLNLAQIKNGDIILDPFCGDGTILQEALFFGANTRGIDIDKKRVKECKENLRWFEKEFEIDRNSEIKRGNAEMASNYFSKNSIDCIVTEPELGPLLKELPDREDAERIINDLEELYLNFFREVDKVLIEGGKIVIVLPRIRTREGKFYEINIKRVLKNTDLEFSKIFDNFEMDMPLEYSESWHKLERLIYIFENNS